ncbi:hypothetical protein L7F22_048507 [Adiantum nelumboides]|nr:hypothetical protein [Adiantum nelumboides]
MFPSSGDVDQEPTGATTLPGASTAAKANDSSKTKPAPSGPTADDDDSEEEEMTQEEQNRPVSKPSTKSTSKASTKKKSNDSLLAAYGRGNSISKPSTKTSKSRSKNLIDSKLGSDADESEGEGNSKSRSKSHQNNKSKETQQTESMLTAAGRPARRSATTAASYAPTVDKNGNEIKRKSEINSRAKSVTSTRNGRRSESMVSTTRKGGNSGDEREEDQDEDEDRDQGVGKIGKNKSNVENSDSDSDVQVIEDPTSNKSKKAPASKKKPNEIQDSEEEEQEEEEAENINNSSKRPSRAATSRGGSVSTRGASRSVSPTKGRSKTLNANIKRRGGSGKVIKKRVLADSDEDGEGGSKDPVVIIGGTDDESEANGAGKEKEDDQRSNQSDAELLLSSRSRWIKSVSPNKSIASANSAANKRAKTLAANQKKKSSTMEEPEEDEEVEMQSSWKRKKAPARVESDDEVEAEKEKEIENDDEDEEISSASKRNAAKKSSDPKELYHQSSNASTRGLDGDASIYGSSSVRNAPDQATKKSKTSSSTSQPKKKNYGFAGKREYRILDP